MANAQLFLFGDAMREVHRALAATVSSARFLASDCDPCAFLEPPAATHGAVVLVKGSREMRLDRVVDQLLRDADSLLPQPAGDQVPRPDSGRWQLQFSE